MLRKLAILLAAMLVAGSAGAQAPWRPTKPIEFIVTSGPGGWHGHLLPGPSK